MKKWLIGFVLIIILLIGSVYVLIPSKLAITSSARISAKSNAISRSLNDAKSWKKWWPAQNTDYRSPDSPEHTFYNDGISYHINNLFYNKIEISARDNRGNEIPGLLSLLDLNNDSIAVQWQYLIYTGPNPLRRIQLYSLGKTLGKNQQQIFKSLTDFLSNQENLYGVNIRRVVIKDTSLVSSRSAFKSRPGIPELYREIEKLRTYIESQGAKETNYPMLNITDSADNRFFMQVAIPVDRLLPDHGNFKLKRMPPVRILESAVKGGPYIIGEALRQMEIYARDYQIGSPAIPFELLITDRLSQPDTTKWITRLYYPIY